MILKNCRLSSQEIQSIQDVFHQYFGANDKLWLFGSRVDPLKKGGDIDLYIETLEPDAKVAFQNKLKFIGGLQLKIGEQKIDVVLHLMNSQVHLPIYDVARQEGVQLV